MIPNVVKRGDGSFCAFDATPLHQWAKAGGSVYQEQLRRILSRDLGVEWGPDRNGCREMAGFNEDQLGTFSKRSAQIEAWLEAHGVRYESPTEGTGCCCTPRSDAARSGSTTARPSP